jgi:hypothetical protein
MRIESSATAISWIPSEAVEGMQKMPFEVGIAHYDDPLPDVIDDLEALRAADRFRFANELRAWVDVEDGRIVDCGHAGKGHIGVTKARLGSREIVFTAVQLPDLRPQPELSDTSVRFIQTAGGRTGAPAPRRVSGKPFFKVEAPTAWSTLALTIHADGSSEHELLGASPFPRHWIYDHSGRLVAKTGLVDFKHWFREAFGRHTPWGDQDSPAFVTQVETALERNLSKAMMHGDREPEIRKLPEGETLTEQGEEATGLYLLLDGVLSVEVDGKALANVGPGAIVGERALLEHKRRTSTLRAATRCKVAVVSAAGIDEAALAQVASGHRREEGP